MEGMKANKIPITFKATKEEIELYNWIKSQSKIIGQSNYIKNILYIEMLKDKATKK